jgi:hypothetical protein
MKTSALTVALLGFLSSLLAAPAAAETVEAHYTFAEPRIEQIGAYTRVTMDGAWSTAPRGEPVLPVAPARLLLPPGEVAVGVTITPGVKVSLGTGFVVEPAQGEYPLSYDGPVERVAAEYQGHGPFPGRLHDDPNVGFFRGRSIATLALHPVEYDPADGSISYYTSLDVEVETAPDTAAASACERMFRRDDATEARVAALTDNPGARSLYRGLAEHPVEHPILDPSLGYRYLIITTEAWSPYLDGFVDFQTRRGNKAGVFLASQITASYHGVDEAAQIRRFIIDAYRTWGIEYVLLVGDASDPDGIPDRGLYAYADDSATREVDNNIPADVYYAALDGSWNDDGDALWGEPGEADLYPEIAVGRACVSDRSQLEAFIDKSERYATQPVRSESDEVLLVGEYLWPATYGGTYKDEIRFGSNAHGYVTAGFPSTMHVRTLYDLDGAWNASSLISLMENGVNIVNHLGHCNNYYVMRMWPLDIPRFDNDGATHSLNFVYTQGCYGGAFDNRTPGGTYESDCFIETFVGDDDAAVAAVANSRYGWGEVGGTNGSSQYFDREFFDAMFGEGIYPIGKALTDSKADVVWAINYAANRWCFYEINLFGDPALELWTAEPRDLSVEHSPLMITGQAALEVAVTDGDGAPVPGARVTVSSDDLPVYATDITGSDGRVLVEASPRTKGTLHLVVTAHDFVPYEDDVGVIAATDSYLVLCGHAVDDDLEGASLGNGDGIVDAGETIELSVDVENLGGGAAESVTGTVSSTSEYVTVVDGELSCPDIPSGEQEWSLDPCVIAISPDAPDGAEVPLTLTLSDGSRRSWECSIELVLAAPRVVCAGRDPDDPEPGGDGSGCGDAGETVSIAVSLANHGTAGATGILASLSTESPYVSVDQGTATLDVLAPGAETLLASPFTITLLEGCPPAEQLVFDLAIEADWGYSAEAGFEIVTGGGGFADDVESDSGIWQSGPATAGYDDAWHVETARSRSPGHSWKFGGSGTLEYPSPSDGALAAGPFCIGAGAELTFWDWLAAEQEGPTTGWDCALVEISTDLGETWAPLAPVAGYTHVKATASDSPLPSGTPCWSGEHDWRQEAFDLSSYAGESVKIRLRFAADAYVGMEGWYVDDIVFDAGGGGAGPVAGGVAPAAFFALRQNAPNPFNPATEIAYELPEATRVRIDVFNIAGRLVRTLVDTQMPAGRWTTSWDGTDATGERVASGAYFYRMTAGAFEARRVMILLK